MTDWDPTIYLKNEDLRSRPAIDLLNRVSINQPTHIYDIGCGPGNSTELLIRRWPSAQITGIDNSDAMLQEARTRQIKAEWQLEDIGTWAPKQPGDLIFSNAALHWLPDHPTLFPTLTNFLETDGVLAVQMPFNFDSPSHLTIARIASEPQWPSDVRQLHETNFSNTLLPTDYAEILAPFCSEIDIWTTEYVQLLSGENAVYEWLLGSALRPYVSSLTKEEAQRFLGACREALASAYPRNTQGLTPFPFKRLFVVVHKR